jgi:hypothetical protein
MAETGRPLPPDHPGNVGASGGGFDKLQFKLPEPKGGFEPAEICTAIDLNRRDSGAMIRIPIPIYGGGMSFGSVSVYTMVARAKAAKKWSTFTCTGEGGYPDDPVQGPCHHPDRHWPVRRPGGDHPAH